MGKPDRIKISLRDFWDMEALQYSGAYRTDSGHYIVLDSPAHKAWLEFKAQKNKRNK